MLQNGAMLYNGWSILSHISVVTARYGCHHAQILLNNTHLLC